MALRRLTLLLVLLAPLASAASAKKAPLWSLQPVTHPAVPEGVTKSSNPIDAFVAATYREKGLRPTGQADKLTLLRRVYLDLTGIPPTPAEQDAFLQNESADAYEKLVDGLLASEQHGVRYARHWLDVMRYSDLDDGMPAASGIYLWRDWVIRALNRDLPYDAFVRAQITGNRLSVHSTVNSLGYRNKVQPRPDDIMALGFLARGAASASNKGQELALSAVDTISTAFLGMTVGCAKCHDHMYDPITQADFYSMKALFDPLVPKKITLATAAEAFAYGQAVDEYETKKAALEGPINALIEPYRKKLYEERLVALPPEAQRAIRKPEKERTLAEQKIADDYFPILRIDPPKMREIMPADEWTKYSDLRKQLAQVTPPAELPSFWSVEEDSKRAGEKCYILNSGDPERPEKNKEVRPGFPFMPKNVDFREGRREGFVDWLTAPENPLFARVAVNRIWQWHLGEGLHKLPSDFGLLGGRPGNPKLLDWLASEFVGHQYSMKWLHRLIVTSDTYRLASDASPRVMAANRKIDPDNTYLWRFRLQRLEAEPLWDSILYNSGDLDLGVGGKSFQPAVDDPRPGRRARGSFDTRTNRRGIYMVRGYQASSDVMPNFLQVFDVDDGRAPCPLRTQTVTAPQSLLLMNSDLIEKASGKLADRLIKEANGDLGGAVELGYRVTLCRAPSGDEKDKALTYLEGDAARLKGLSWMLFNLDEFIYVR